MDPEVNQGMVMETTQDKMKMKPIMTWTKPGKPSFESYQDLSFKLHTFLSSNQIA
jgi:hypothetical protein